ncbi:MAG: polyprenyl synthetase family protein, partial [Actinobacteria bacterium]|nr:polyprenyl synthetase family protein [Actinomycetota bacterium]
AFQLADDILDIVGYEADTGKKPGTDLRAGVFTLPVLATLRGDAGGGDELHAALETTDVDAALGVLRSNGSIDITRDVASQWAARGRAALERVPAGAARDALAALAGDSPDRRA